VGSCCFVEPSRASALLRELYFIFPFRSFHCVVGTMYPLPSSPPSSHGVDLPTYSSTINTQTPLRPQTRKITIKNLKSTPDSVPAAYFLQTTQKLQRAVSTILVEGNLVDSLEELYRGVENLVRENKGPELYEMLQDSCQKFVSGNMRENVEKGIVGSVGLGGDGGVRAVECIERAWGKWTSQLV
jgi:cullin 4